MSDITALDTYVLDPNDPKNALIRELSQQKINTLKEVAHQKLGLSWTRILIISIIIFVLLLLMLVIA